MSNLTDFKKLFLESPRAKIAYIIVLALVIRIISFAIAIHLDRFYTGAQDFHTEIGRNIIDGNWLKFDNNRFLAYRDLIRSHPTGWVDLNNLEVESNEELSSVLFLDPGYGILAGLIWKCWGKIDWTPVILLQIIIDSLMCLLLYLIGRKVGDRGKGLFIALLFAVFPLEIMLSILPNYDIWVSFFYISSVYLILLEQEQKKKWISLSIIAGLGVLSAYTAWIRSTIVLFPPLIGLYLLLKREKFQWAKAAILIVIFISLYIIPTAYNGYINSGEFQITRRTIWFSFYCGLGQFKNNFGGDGTDASAMNYCIEKEPNLAGKSYVYNWQRYEELLEPRVKEIIREDPLWYAGTVLKRVGVILFPGFYYHKAGVFKFIPSYMLIFLQALLIIWSLLFLFGYYIGLRKHPKVYIVLLLPYLYVLVTISPFFLQGRVLTNIFFIQLFGGIEAIWYIRERIIKAFFLKESLSKEN